jgi:hypothetical protein
MSATAPIERPGMTAEELLELPQDGLRHELVGGELRTMAPAGAEHGLVALRIGARIFVHVDEHGLGAACRLGWRPSTTLVAWSRCCARTACSTARACCLGSGCRSRRCSAEPA